MPLPKISIVLGLLLLQATPSYAASNFQCGTAEGSQCSCSGVEDCHDMRKSGMCDTSLFCTTVHGTLICSCMAKLQGGNASRVPTLPGAKKLP